VKGDIEFLSVLKEDLMEAAKRERDPSTERVLLAGRRPRPARLVAALAAALLTVSGVVGYLATRPGKPAHSEVARSGGYTMPVGGTPNAMPSASIAPAGHGPAPGSAGRPGKAFSPVPGGPRGSVPNVPVEGPRVIKAARIVLQVPKGTFKERYDAASRIADTYGGYIQSSSTGGDKLKSGGLVIRVPVGDFGKTVSALQGLGDVQHRSITGRDVTADFVDLNARLRNTLAEEARLREFLKQAPDVQSSLRVNAVLSGIELQIEQLRGQLRYLEHRADLATIDVELAEKAPKAQEHAVPSHQSLGGAWHDAVDGFFGVATSVVTGLGYVIPIGFLLAIAVLVIWLITRRIRSRAIV
jgi:hypothetical protein